MDKKLTVKEFIEEKFNIKLIFEKETNQHRSYYWTNNVEKLAEQLPSECGECEYKTNDKTYGWQVCSLCDFGIEEYPVGSGCYWNFCPNCGAKIKRSDNGEMGDE